MSSASEPDYLAVSSTDDQLNASRISEYIGSWQSTDNCETHHTTVAILGAPNSGKSTLANALFDVCLPTEKWVKGLLICKSELTGSLVLDTVGFREHNGEEDTISPMAVVRFATYISDMLIINLWEMMLDIPKYTMDLLKVVFIAHTYFFGCQKKTRILFVIRDHLDTTSLDKIVDVSRKCINDAWASVAKPERMKTLTAWEIFEFKIIQLPHFILTPELFRAAIDRNRPRFTDKGDPRYLFKPEYSKSVMPEDRIEYLRNALQYSREPSTYHSNLNTCRVRLLVHELWHKFLSDLAPLKNIIEAGGVSERFAETIAALRPKTHDMLDASAERTLSARVDMCIQHLFNQQIANIEKQLLEAFEAETLVILGSSGGNKDIITDQFKALRRKTLERHTDAIKETTSEELEDVVMEDMMARFSDMLITHEIEVRCNYQTRIAGIPVQQKMTKILETATQLQQTEWHAELARKYEELKRFKEEAEARLIGMSAELSALLDKEHHSGSKPETRPESGLDIVAAPMRIQSGGISPVLAPTRSEASTPLALGIEELKPSRYQSQEENSKLQETFRRLVVQHRGSGGAAWCGDAKFVLAVVVDAQTAALTFEDAIWYINRHVRLDGSDEMVLKDAKCKLVMGLAAVIVDRMSHGGSANRKVDKEQASRLVTSTIDIVRAWARDGKRAVPGTSHLIVMTKHENNVGVVLKKKAAKGPVVTLEKDTNGAAWCARFHDAWMDQQLTRLNNDAIQQSDISPLSLEYDWMIEEERDNDADVQLLDAIQSLVSSGNAEECTSDGDQTIVD